MEYDIPAMKELAAKIGGLVIEDEGDSMCVVKMGGARNVVVSSSGGYDLWLGKDEPVRFGASFEDAILFLEEKA